MHHVREQAHTIWLSRPADQQETTGYPHMEHIVGKHFQAAQHYKIMQLPNTRVLFVAGTFRFGPTPVHKHNLIPQPSNSQRGEFGRNVHVQNVTNYTQN